jgi:hypothetical protein
MRKRLLIIPVAHSEAEMGSLSADIAKVLEGALGRERRERHRAEVAAFWERLKVLLERLLKDVDMRTVKVYQDGIPVGGELGMKLVNDCARTGSPNFQLLASLIEKGATLEKTEDTRLLKEEYEILKELVSAKTASEREERAEQYKKRLYALTEERDSYIAAKIKETLGEDELGILFIGATHSIVPFLPPEIDTFVCDYVEADIMDWLWGKKPAEK